MHESMWESAETDHTAMVAEGSLVSQADGLADRFRSLQVDRAQQAMDKAQKAVDEAPTEEDQVSHMNNFIGLQDLRNKLQRGASVEKEGKVGQSLVVEASLDGGELVVVAWSDGSVTEELPEDLKLL